MLADFAMRMVFGLAFATVAGSRGVPRSYPRTTCLVLLGLSVLAALAAGRGGGWGFRGACATAVGSYLGATAWTLGRERVGLAATGIVAVVAAVVLAATTEAGRGWGLEAAARGASGLVIGAVLAAMLLGHQYLTAPTTSIDPLQRAIGLIGAALAIRVVLELIGVVIGDGSAASGWIQATLRWGMGLAAPAVAVVLAWKSAGIRSTQSATGILFAALGLVLAGELASMASPHDDPALVRVREGGPLRWN